MKRKLNKEYLPLRYMSALEKAYPAIWEKMDTYKISVASKEVTPNWCFCPIVVAYSVYYLDFKFDYNRVFNTPTSTEEARLHNLYNWLPPTTTALYTWKATKGIYRFDKTLSAELRTMSISGDLPVQTLLRLPEWCMYLDFSDDPIMDVLGAFVYLEYDTMEKTSELYICAVQSDDGYLTLPIRIFIGEWSIEESIKMTLDRDYASRSHEAYKYFKNMKDDYIVPLLNHVIYLCSSETDIQAPRPVERRTEPNRTVYGGKTPIEWDVGYRIGATIRKAQSHQPESPSPIHAMENIDGLPRSSPRPHIRRAHWHHYWTGARSGERTLIVKWVHTSLVNTEKSDKLPAVIRDVE